MSISEKNTRTLITLPKELKEQLEAIAKNDNRSFNNLVVKILSDFVKHSHKITE
jgi:Arc-like DNA binding domain.